MNVSTSSPKFITVRIWHLNVMLVEEKCANRFYPLFGNKILQNDFLRTTWVKKVCISRQWRHLPTSYCYHLNAKIWFTLAKTQLDRRRNFWGIWCFEGGVKFNPRNKIGLNKKMVYPMCEEILRHQYSFFEFPVQCYQWFQILILLLFDIIEL